MQALWGRSLNEGLDDETEILPSDELVGGSVPSNTNQMASKVLLDLEIKFNLFFEVLHTHAHTEQVVM